MSKYPRVLRAVAQTHWAIREEKLAEIKSFLTRVAGDAETDDAVQAAIKAQFGEAPERPRLRVGSVEIIPVQGVISQKVNLMSEFSGGTSTEMLGAQIDKAIADPQISSILLDVDSPGGSVYGLTEIADRIRAAREKKRIVAVANPEAASAAYWIASAASELVVPPSGHVGSIGVVMIHDDITKNLEMNGIKTTVIRSGKHKVEGNPFEPLTEEARAAMQAANDAYYEMFIRDVAAGRGVDPRTVRASYGQGRMLLAADAKAAGMVDRIATFDATLGRMLMRGARANGERAFDTVRDFEAFLRDEGMVSNAQAKRIAAEGFTKDEQPLRDGAGKTEPQPVKVESQEGLSDALRAYIDSVNSR